jgi:hypothetical protein
MAESVIVGVEFVDGGRHASVRNRKPAGWMLACAGAPCRCLADNAYSDPRPSGPQDVQGTPMRSPFPLFWLLAALTAAGFTAMAVPASAQEAAPAVAASPIRYSGGDGSTLKKSIVIAGAASTGEGEAAELDWIREHHPGATFQSRGRITGPPHYDVVTVKLASGALLDLHFDISGFFGK